MNIFAVLALLSSTQAINVKTKATATTATAASASTATTAKATVNAAAKDYYGNNYGNYSQQLGTNIT
jgi:topoisomerase IA-like protein